MTNSRVAPHLRPEVFSFRVYTTHIWLIFRGQTVPIFSARPLRKQLGKWDERARVTHAAFYRPEHIAILALRPLFPSTFSQKKVGNVCFMRSSPTIRRVLWLLVSFAWRICLFDYFAVDGLGGSAGNVLTQLHLSATQLAEYARKYTGANAKLLSERVKCTRAYFLAPNGRVSSSLWNHLLRRVS